MFSDVMGYVFEIVKYNLIFQTNQPRIYTNRTNINGYDSCSAV